MAGIKPSRRVESGFRERVARSPPPYTIFFAIYFSAVEKIKNYG